MELNLSSKKDIVPVRALVALDTASFSVFVNVSFASVVFLIDAI